MIKRGLIFTVMLLLFFYPVFAEDWIFNSNSADLNVDISSEIQITGSVKDLRVNLSLYPKSSDFQNVLSQTSQPEAEKEQDSLIFFWPNPSQNKVTMQVNSKIRSYEKIQPIYSKVSFPIKNLDTEYEDYLEPSELINSDNKQIIAKASELASGETDLYKVVHKIGKWIKENIEYDLDPSLIYSSQSASWTLENKKAVCDEMSTLFIALNRAMGIPAKFVSGYAYTDDPRFREGWGPHAWAEVYFPGNGWVPIDVTYGQLGDVDLTHVELRKGADVTKSSTYYSWYGGEVNTEELKTEISLVSTTGAKESPIELKTSVIKQEVGFGSYNLMEVEIENKRNYYVPVTLITGASEIIEIMGDNIEYVILEPRQTKKLYWLIKVQNDLDSKYIYTAYLTAATQRTNNTVSLSIDADNREYSFDDMQERLEELEQEEEKSFSKDILINCGYKSSIYVSDDLEIKCNLTNMGNINFENLKVCLGTDCETINLKINQQNSVDFSYSSDAAGEKNLKVKATNTEITKIITLTVNVLGKPEVDIGISSPNSVMFDQEFDIKVNLTAGSSPVANSKIKIYTNNRQIYEKYIGDLTSQQLILQIEGSQLDQGMNNIKVELEFSDLKNNTYTESETFAITLEQLTLWQSIMHFFIHLFA
jgi:transglutaminase-like putative cysteine protease